MISIPVRGRGGSCPDAEFALEGTSDTATPPWWANGKFTGPKLQCATDAPGEQRKSDGCKRVGSPKSAEWFFVFSLSGWDF
jgi:hypothetical protein